MSSMRIEKRKLFFVFLLINCSGFSQNNLCDSIKYENANKYEQNGYKTGKWITYDASTCRIIQIDTFLYGKKNGTTVSYMPNGQILSKFHFVNDTVDGLCFTYVIGGETCYFEYKQNKREGEVRVYDVAGILIKKYNYVNDILQGNYYTYFKSGKINTKTTYLNGQENGSRLIYRDNKQNDLLREFIFENGVRLKSIYYNRKGKVKKYISE